jgi:large conductance mechanosensitive channel
MLAEFRKFIMRGNVLDLAIGVIIGGAFGAIVNSLVNDIIMPLVGLLLGGLSFENYFIPLSAAVTADTLAAAREQGAVLAWGNFVTIVINFLIIAFIIFQIVRIVNRFSAPPPPPPPPPGPTKEEKLLTEIRDLLARGR